MSSLRVGSKTDPIRLAVFISGSGTGMLALENYSRDKQLTTRYIRTTVGRIVFNKMILAKV